MDLRGGPPGNKHPYKSNDLRSISGSHNGWRTRHLASASGLYTHVYTCAYKHIHMHITHRDDNKIFPSVLTTATLCLSYINDSANCHKYEIKASHGNSVLWSKHSETWSRKDLESSKPAWLRAKFLWSLLERGLLSLISASHIPSPVSLSGLDALTGHLYCLQWNILLDSYQPSAGRFPWVKANKNNTCFWKRVWSAPFNLSAPDL